MPGVSFSGMFKRLSPEEENLKEELKGHVQYLAENIGERNLWHYESLDAAANYIHSVLNQYKCKVNKQSFKVQGKTVSNIEAEFVGTTLAQEIVIVGAHYDTCIGSPGANDNGTGVAALLAIARLLEKKNFKRTLKFVAFVNEEPPFFQSDEMGSYVYAKHAKEQNEKIEAMFSLETIGYYSDKKGSQKYPIPFSLFYPDQGNFIAFVSNLESAELLKKSIKSFRENTAFPSEGAAAAQWIPGIAWSDQWSFWKMNYPAIMITDTAPFRYPHYHLGTDLHQYIDFDRLARVTQGLCSVICDQLGMKE
jgi:Zn-dependent M28 family amino/carboxypeptidase